MLDALKIGGSPMRIKSLMVLTGLTIFLVCSGCAFVDQRISLRYGTDERTTLAGTGDKLLLLVGPEGSDRLNKKGGSYILGNVKNSYGIKTADTITDDRIDDWIVTAFSKELHSKGITVRRVPMLPAMFDYGMSVMILRVWIEQDPGMFTVGSVSDVSLLLEIYSKGNLVKKFSIDGKGDKRGMFSTSGDREASLEKALKAVMAQAIPEILSVMR
jgi:hypothetical protein